MRWNNVNEPQFRVWWAIIICWLNTFVWMCVPVYVCEKCIFTEILFSINRKHIIIDITMYTVNVYIVQQQKSLTIKVKCGAQNRKRNISIHSKGKEINFTSEMENESRQQAYTKGTYRYYCTIPYTVRAFVCMCAWNVCTPMGFIHYTVFMTTLPNTRPHSTQRVALNNSTNNQKLQPSKMLSKNNDFWNTFNYNGLARIKCTTYCSFSFPVGFFSLHYLLFLLFAPPDGPFQSTRFSSFFITTFKWNLFENYVTHDSFWSPPKKTKPFPQ